MFVSGISGSHSYVIAQTSDATLHYAQADSTASGWNISGKISAFAKSIISGIGDIASKVSRGSDQATSRLVGRVAVYEKNQNTGKIERIFKGKLGDLGLTKSQFNVAKNAGKAGSLIKSSQALLNHSDLASITGKTGDEAQKAIKKIIKLAIPDALGNFTLALQNDFDPELDKIKPDKNDVLVRIKDHKIEVWKKEGFEHAGSGVVIAKIQNIATGKEGVLKFATITADVTINSIQTELSKAKEFEKDSLGLGVEGEVMLGEAGSIGLVTEFKGEDYLSSIETRLEKEKSLPATDVMQRRDKEALALCSSLNTMHETKTHGDIKPGNMVLTEKDDALEAQFIDLSSSRDLTDHESGLGEYSLKYTPPKEAYRLEDIHRELAGSKKATAKETELKQERIDRTKAMDIHQMGVSLYLRCCGKVTQPSPKIPKDFDAAHLPKEIRSDENGYSYMGEMKENLFDGAVVSPKLQNLIKAMLTEDPTQRIDNYNRALEAFQSTS